MNAALPSSLVADDMPFADYRAHEALSQSGARKLLRSPAHFVTDRERPAEPTAAMRFGSAVHCAVLESEAFRDRYAKAPKCDNRTTAGRAMHEQFLLNAAGKVALSEDEFETVQSCALAVRDHPGAMRLLQGARVEVSAFWQDRQHDVPCKARFDALSHGGIVDLKTATDASKDAFARSIATYGYDLQAAFYSIGHEHVLDATPEFYALIAVETEPPFAVACYELGSASIMAGMRMAEEALARYAQCRKADRWPGYADTIEPIDTPGWARKF